MAAATPAPTPIASVIDDTAFRPAPFWSARLASVLALAAGLYAFHVLITPKLGIYDVRLIALSFIFATLAVSLNLINGVTGQFSIGHAAFYLIGAITAGKVSVLWIQQANMPPIVWLFLMVIVGGTAASLAGFIVGLPSLRLRGDYLAVATLGFGEIVNVILRNQDGGKQSIFGLDLGGAYGLQEIPKLTPLWAILLLFIGTLAVSRNLLRCAHGLSFLAVREDELAADATGVPTTKIKVTAFVLGAAIAGMAGALFAHYNGVVSPDDFKMDTSFILVAMVVIGGTGSITGAAVAGVSLKLLEEGLRKLGQIAALHVYSLIVAAILVYLIYRWLSKRGALRLDSQLRPLWTALGALASAGIVFLGYRLYGTEMSWVLKIAGLLMMLITLVAMTLTGARTVALPRFGLFATCLTIVIFTAPYITKGFHAIGPIEKLLGETTYTASDLRWAVFSISLVFIMVLRPQGMMGHHELSWAFIKSLFTGRAGKGARA